LRDQVDAIALWPRYVSVMHVGLEARNPEPLGHLRVIVITSSSSAVVMSND
jgi:hypothetical protein